MSAAKAKQRRPIRVRKATRTKRPSPAPDRGSDSEQIERAVFDGMQDLRANQKP